MDHEKPSDKQANRQIDRDRGKFKWRRENCVGFSQISVKKLEDEGEAKGEREQRLSECRWWRGDMHEN